ncbi:MAG: heptaprenyl diphosphate synthase component [Bacillota bacterium]|jgi:heptaprenyl diphosphate synthase|nr:heptaprenyl diphosphate synthase component [Bacillota bacterium]
MKTKSITRLSILLTVALILGYFENLIPLNASIPGVKLGLSNTVLMYAIYMINIKDAFILMILKVILSGILFAGVSGAIYSFAGGLLSLIMMIVIKKVPDVSIIGVSVVGAVFHNVGQIAMASLVVENKYIFFYLPVLLISAVTTGVLTGIIAKYTLKALSSNNISTYIK